MNTAALQLHAIVKYICMQVYICVMYLAIIATV